MTITSFPMSWKRRASARPGLIGGFHLPATVIPLGLTVEGLPVGAQIVGSLYGDRITIGMASLVEELSCAFTPPPGY